MTKPLPIFKIGSRECTSIHFSIERNLRYTNPQTGLTAVWKKGATLQLNTRTPDARHKLADPSKKYGLTTMYATKSIGGYTTGYLECLETYVGTDVHGWKNYILPTADTDEELVLLAINLALQNATNLDSYDGQKYKSLEQINQGDAYGCSPYIPMGLTVHKSKRASKAVSSNAGTPSAAI